MPWKAISENITVKYPQVTITGPILYDPGSQMLVHQDPHEGDEVLSTDLFSSGWVAEPGECFIKDWSEHSGWARALAEAGIVEIVEEISVGKADAQAYRVRVMA